MGTPDDPLTFSALLQSVDVMYTRGQFRRGDAIFTQGEPCDHVRFLESGSVSLSVTSATGKEGIVAVLGAGDFLGEGCLAGQPCFTGSATALKSSTVIAVGKHHMLRLLHQQHAMSDRFIARMLVRNLRSEADLVDHLFNSCERRLARTLLLLAGYDKPNPPNPILNISQETLGAMVGTTRSRINVLLNAFKARGFIDTQALACSRSIAPCST